MPRSNGTMDGLLCLLALFIPPLPVFLKRGIGFDFFLNIFLWILLWLPGVIHAWYIICTTPGTMY